MRNRIELGAGSLRANARFEAPDEKAFSLVRSHGHPKARTKSVESCGHDPDKRHRSTAQDKTFAKNPGIASEFSLPKPVTHHKHWRRTRAAIFLRNRATQQWRHAQIVKSVSRYGLARRQNAGGFAIIIKEPAHDSVSNHVFENMILFPEGAEFLGREVDAAFRSADACGIANFKHNRPIEVFVRKRVEEHVVDDAEDDRGSADTESQGEDGDEGEAAVFAKGPEGVAKVAGETIEVGFHTSKLYTEAAANCRDLTTKEKAGGPAFIPSDLWMACPLCFCCCKRGAFLRISRCQFSSIPSYPAASKPLTSNH